MIGDCSGMMGKLRRSALEAAGQAARSREQPSDNESSRDVANGPSSFPCTCARQDITRRLEDVFIVHHPAFAITSAFCFRDVCYLRDLPTRTQSCGDCEKFVRNFAATL